MPGVPGRGGPAPKRSDQRLGHRSKAAKDAVDRAPALDCEPPPAEESWHPIARAWYESLTTSGQAAWYQASDWATAVILAENMSRDLKPRPIGVHPESGEPVLAKVAMNGASLTAYLRGMAALLTTEAERRRSRLELDRGDAAGSEDEAVAILDEYRRRRAG